MAGGGGAGSANPPYMEGHSWKMKMIAILLCCYCIYVRFLIKEGTERKFEEHFLKIRSYMRIYFFELIYIKNAHIWFRGWWG